MLTTYCGQYILQRCAFFRDTDGGYVLYKRLKHMDPLLRQDTLAPKLGLRFPANSSFAMGHNSVPVIGVQDPDILSGGKWISHKPWSDGGWRCDPACVCIVSYFSQHGTLLFCCYRWVSVMHLHEHGYHVLLHGRILCTLHELLLRHAPSANILCRRRTEGGVSDFFGQNGTLMEITIYLRRQCLCIHIRWPRCVQSTMLICWHMSRGN